jgi:hypothetical protein
MSQVLSPASRQPSKMSQTHMSSASISHGAAGVMPRSNVDARWASEAGTDSIASSTTWRIIGGLGLVILAVLAFANLTTYPAMWFDEGIHLHVPKALVKFGVYADYSSEGFRFYGPTMSVGPTVMLPVALAFKVAGIGLLQARLVMVGYMFAALAVFWLLGRQLARDASGRTTAAYGPYLLPAIAVALLVSSRGVDFVYYGRQMLGEVPALMYLLAGLACWFASWESKRASGRLMVVAGLCFGLSVVTKYQYLILIAPGLGLAWVVDRAYYRLLKFRFFLVPGLMVIACFAGWQALAVLYLGPAEAGSNLETMRKAAAGAAMSFSPEQVARALYEVLKPAVYSSLLLPALIYTAYRSREKSYASFRWIVLLCLIAANLGWFVIASIGWARYAFAAFALAAFPVARLACDALIATGVIATRASSATAAKSAGAAKSGGASLDSRRIGLGGLVAAIVVAFTILAPLAFDLRDVLRPPPSAAAGMAQLLNKAVPQDAIIETYDPEMGFLTDHRYHYPPPTLLIRAVAFQWSGGRPPAEAYDFRTGNTEPPPYVLEGPFGKYVGLYPESRLNGYTLKATSGSYSLFERLPQAGVALGAAPAAR